MMGILKKKETKTPIIKLYTPFELLVKRNTFISNNFNQVNSKWNIIVYTK